MAVLSHLIRIKKGNAEPICNRREVRQKFVGGVRAERDTGPVQGDVGDLMRKHGGEPTRLAF